MTIFLAVLGPVLGLLGVATGLWVGERRWKRDAVREDAKMYREKLVTTYLELWDVVQDTHVQMRESVQFGLTATTFSGLLADVNNFMIRRGAFIERQDRYLVLEYLFWTNEYLRQLVTDPRGRDALMSSLVHDDLPHKVSLLKEVELKADSLRDQLRDRVRQIAGAEDTGGWAASVKPSTELLEQLDSLLEQVRRDRDDVLTERPEMLELPPISDREIV